MISIALIFIGICMGLCLWFFVYFIVFEKKKYPQYVSSKKSIRGRKVTDLWILYINESIALDAYYNNLIETYRLEFDIHRSPIIFIELSSEGPLGFNLVVYEGALFETPKNYDSLHKYLNSLKLIRKYDIANPESKDRIVVDIKETISARCILIDDTKHGNSQIRQASTYSYSGGKKKK